MRSQIRRRPQYLQRWLRRLWTIGFWGCLLLVLLLGLWLNPPQPGELPWLSRREISGEIPAPCSELVNEQGKITPEDWRWLKSVAAGAAQAHVREALGAPYCVLPPLYVQANSPAQRHVYQFQAWKKRWLILLYEDEKYVGYDVLNY